MLYNVITKLYNVRDTNTPVELWRGGGLFFEVVLNKYLAEYTCRKMKTQIK